MDRLVQRRRRLNVKRPPPPKTGIAAALMLVGRLALLVLGTVASPFDDFRRGGAFLVMVFLCEYSSLPPGNILSIDYYPHGAPGRCVSFVSRLPVFMPGSYQATILWGAYHMWSGYSYTQVLSYGD
jgi:hypothetical protein